MYFGLRILVVVAGLMSSTLNSTPEQLRRSKSVQKVVKEAQVASGRTITIKPFDSPGLYSGETNFSSGSEIVIQIESSLPRRTGTSNLIHESYHVLLASEGLQLTAGSTKFNEPGDIRRLFTAAGKQLTERHK